MSRLEKVNVTYLVTVIAALTGSVILSVFPLFKGDSLLRLLVSQILYAFPVLCYFISIHESPERVFRWNKIPLMNVFLLLLFSFFIMPLLSFLNALSMLFVTNRISGTVEQITGQYPVFVSLLCVALIPALLEESVYRGAFFQEYRKINPNRAIILSGLLFGMLHLNLNQFLYAFIMGMIFALLVEVNDSLAASVIVHFMINGFSTVTMYLSGKGTADGRGAGDTLAAAGLGDMVVILGVASVFTTAIAYLLLRIMAKKSGRSLPWKQKSSNQGRLVTPPLLAAMVICIVIMFYMEIAAQY